MNNSAGYFCGVKFTFFLVASFVVLCVTAQKSIVDDSTKQVYGPKTVEMTNEDFIKNNIAIRYWHPDTTVYRKEKYDRVDASERQFQSLGFIGSPLFDLEYELSNKPGRTFGINGYDPYFKSVNEINYYNTKSPYIDMQVILGGSDRSKIDFEFSRNINAHWNVGFDINRITADKQIALQAQGDRSVESAAFDIYTHFYNKEKPYEIAFSYHSLNHQVADIGGVDVPDDPTIPDFYLYQDAETQLSDAASQDKRSRMHLFHQYKLGSGFQLYHQADLTNQEYRFTNDSNSGETQYDSYYPQYLLNEDITSEQNSFSSFENEIGMKGDIQGAFYRFYLKRRALIYDQKYALETSIGETYAGTYLRFDWKDKFSVIGQGEVSNEGAYQLEGTLKSDLIKGSYTSQRALPSFILQNYSGNHHQWSNSFDPVFSNTIKGEMNLKWNVFELNPRVSVTTRSNHIYFNSSQVPEQIGSTLLINKIGGDVAINFFKFNDEEYFRLENSLTLSQVSGDASDVIRIPEFRGSGRLFWRGNWFQNAVPVEIGADLYYRTAYFGNQYDPVLAQYYINDELELQAYPAVDFFINMKIGNLRAYLKWNHINQQINDGYMATPYYPAQRTVFDLGVQWLFFD